MYVPTISIITLNYNADSGIWKKALDSIKMQDYPRKNIEHLVMDYVNIYQRAPGCHLQFW